MFLRLFKKKRRFHQDIHPDEILLDAQNISKLNTQQFEGKIERPVSQLSLRLLMGSFLIVSIVFGVKLQALQIQQGEEFLEKSRNNSLSQHILFANRGIIYDRNLVELTWNQQDTIDQVFPTRVYTDEPGFSHVLGYVGYPEKDAKGYYWQKEFIGKAGIESFYNTALNGRNGLKLIERNVQGDLQSENTVDAPIDGENIVLTLDAGLQATVYRAMQQLVESNGFTGGAAAIMDIKTGELLVATSYPEYNSEILSLGEDTETINNYFSDSSKPFLNRLFSSYTPGSIVKPYLAIAALYEGIIGPNEWLPSNGQIVIPNPYDPSKPTIFKDNKVHGPVDMRRAIAVSANTYFYEIGGGFNGRKGLGIARIEDYMREFGFGSVTGFDILGKETLGVIPNPAWKEKNFAEGVWRIGDTYNSSIGQYGFQVTPMQALRAVATLANKGEMATPYIVKDHGFEKVERISTSFTDEQYRVVHEGMRQTVTDGTSSFFNLPFVSVAAKTGTAQVGTGNKYSHSWSTGFFPYENPKYAFVVFMERAPKDFQLSANFVMRDAFMWMRDNRPQYLK